MPDTPSDAPINFMQYRAARERRKLLAASKAAESGGTVVPPVKSRSRGKAKLSKAASVGTAGHYSYKCGHHVPCRVLAKNPEGYSVLVIRDEIPGFLTTAQDLAIGQETVGLFVCVYRGRIMLSPLLT